MGLWEAFRKWIRDNLHHPVPVPVPPPVPTPTPVPPPTPPAPPLPPPEPEFPEVAVRLLELHNNRRAAASRPPLKLQKQLMAAAESHSNWMATKRKMSHTGANGSSPWDRMRDAGYVGTGSENTAWNFPTPEDVVDGWMHSSGHKANILDKRSEEVGFAVKDLYWTAVFGMPGARGDVVEDIDSLPAGLVYDPVTASAFLATGDYSPPT